MSPHFNTFNNSDSADHVNTNVEKASNISHNGRGCSGWRSRLTYNLSSRRDGVGVSGFTLVELLVVVVILVVIAAIAIPLFLNQKFKAAEAAVVADAKKANDALNLALAQISSPALTDIEYNGGKFICKPSTVCGLDSEGVPAPVGEGVNLEFAATASDWFLVVGDPSTGAYAAFNRLGQISDPEGLNDLTLDALIATVTNSGGGGGGGGGSATPVVVGAAFGWGRAANNLGISLLGDSDVVVPFAVDGGLSFSLVSRALHHTCALDGSGKAYCWGYNPWSPDPLPAIGNTAVNADQAKVPVEVEGGHTFKEIDTGHGMDAASCGVTTGGELYCWGQIMPPWVEPAKTTPTRVNNGSLAGKTVVTVSVGGGGVCAVTSDGKVHCWGGQKQIAGSENPPGANGDGVPQPVEVNSTGVLAGKTITKVSVGFRHACAIDTNNAAYCWGENDSGQLGDNSTNESLNPVVVSAPSGVLFKDISASDANFTCALEMTGDGYCWGSNSSGNIGTGVVGSPPWSYNTPQAVVGGLKFTNISAGGPFSFYTANTCGTTTDKKVYCWGSQSYKQLGNNTVFSSVGEPLQVGNPWELLNGKEAVYVSVGAVSATAIYKDVD